MLKKKWFRIVLNVTAWLVYFTLPHLMRPYHRGHDINGRGHVGFGHSDMAPPDDIHWLFVSALQNLLLIPLFYLNAYYILPRLVRSRNYALLFITQLAGIAVHYGFSVSVSYFLGTAGKFGPHLFISLTSYLLIFSVAYGTYAFRESRRVEEAQKEREMETVKAELQFLRWQISPHFLFNALNNMVAMARKKSDNLEPALIHLSGLMRYMLYETDGSRVHLQKEAEYLKSFIHLQRMRYSNVEMEVDINVPEDCELSIEPMLLIPFVENAFKHGIDLIENPVIAIQLSLDGRTLHVDVANKCLPGNHHNKDEARGIGLANVKKRLDFLYAGRHTLETTIGGWYTVHLKIELA